MLTIKEAKKIPYTELDEETKEYFYDIFKRYVVRKHIAERNKELSSLLSRRLKTTNPREFAGYFNDFNSRFVNATLIRELDYDEIHTNYLRDMSEDRFNYHLQRTGNTFERKIALICFSGRPSERIANRVEFPVLVAYANMQDMVFELAEKYPNMDISQIFQMAASAVRANFVKTHGKKINQTTIAEERTDYKSLGKKAAPVWKQMLEFYMKGLEDIRVLEASQFVYDNFLFTDEARKEYTKKLEPAMKKGSEQLQADREFMQRQADEMPDYYDVADYDEVMYSKHYADDVYAGFMLEPMQAVFHKYLRDPIFEDKAPKEKK